MRFIVPAAFIAVLFLTQSVARAQRLASLDADTAKVGDTVSVSGEGLDKSMVDTLFLTDGKNDIKVDILEQSDTAIKFKIPPKTPAGRWALMIHTKKDQLIEQPVKLTVE